MADLTRYLPGPFASRELLRLGARVVKIEPPDGDPVETTAPGWYGALNEGKERLVWDARTEPPPEVLTQADVVLEGFRPGVLERLGIDLSPEAILCSITGFGVTGRHAADAGHDLNYLGYAGVLADTAPALPPVQIADLCAGAQGAVIEILAALFERARSGHGARIVVSMTHGAHRFAAHRLRGEPLPATPDGRRCLLPDLRDVRRPPRDGGRAGAEVLEPPVRAARAPRSRRPRVRAAPPGARAAVPDASAPRVARPARGPRHVRRPGADAGRGGSRAQPAATA